MYTEYLREFIALARRLNYTQAANDLHVSQPTLSRHIADLEKHFGSQLISRGESCSLTYAGETLLNQANALLRCEDELERAMRDAKGVQITSLKIVDWRYSHTAMDLIRRALGSITAGMSQYRVEFTPVPYGVEIPEALRQGIFDVGILAHTAIGEPEFTEGDDLAVLPLSSTRARLHFFMDARNPLAGRESISFADLYDTPITVPLNPECANIRDDVALICQRFGYQPMFYSTTLASIDDIFCMNLRDSMLIGLAEYQSRGFALGGRNVMVPCSDEAYITIYLLYRRNDGNAILRSLLKELRGE